MSQCRISGFPFAHYDMDASYGFLSYYYPNESKKSGDLSVDQWRNGSYSPEILDFKDGHDSAIQRFVLPFLELIRHALKEESLSGPVFLIPVPTSMPKLDRRFSVKPKEKLGAGRSRDDRLLLFCNLLTQSERKFRVAELIERTTYKKEKSTLSVEQHLRTLRLAHSIQAGLAPTLILVDDVCTNGHTFKACTECLTRGKQTSERVICLALGQTSNPSEFRDIRPKC